jgi:hypothetical protein
MKLLITLEPLNLEKNKEKFGFLKILEIFAGLAKFKSNQILLNKISQRFLLKTNLLIG